MRNLKRVLSLALALVMVLGMMVITTSAATYTDADQIEYKEAVAVMTGVGLYEGNPDGSLAPKQVLTREMAATLIARIMLGNLADDLASTKQIFTDVPTTHWSAKYIEYCYNTGAIVGNGDGTFNPGGELTGTAFAKLLLCAMGYDAGSAGFEGASWEQNIHAAAQAQGLYIEGVKITDKLTREQAAQMVLQALPAKMVRYIDSYDYATGAHIVLGPLDAGKTFKANYFNTLTKDTDVYGMWGRPYEYVWTYQGVEIYSVMKTPVKVYTEAVYECDIAEDLGLKADAKISKWTWNNYPVDVDGEEIELLATKSEMGAQGRLFEVYKNGKTFEIVEIDTWLAQVTDVTECTYDRNGHLDEKAELFLDIYVAYTDEIGDAYADSLVSTKDWNYKANQWLLVNYDEKNQKAVIVGAPETLTGAQTAWTYNDETHEVEDEIYSDAYNFFLDQTEWMETSDHVWFFDTYGNLIGVIDPAKAPDTFGVLSDIYWKDSRDGETGYAYGKITYMDGSYEWKVIAKIVEADETEIVLEGVEGKGADYDNGMVSSTKQYNKVEYTNKALYKIGTSKNGLVLIETTFVEDGQLTTNKKTVIEDEVYVNSKTMFLAYNSKKGTYSAYVGVRNLPEYVNPEIDLWAATVGGTDTNAEYVFVIDPATKKAAAEVSMAVVLTDDTMKMKASLKDDVIVSYKFSNILVNGEKSAVVFDAADDALIDEFTAEMGIPMVLEITDGVVTDVLTKGTEIELSAKPETTFAKVSVLGAYCLYEADDESLYVDGVWYDVADATLIGARSWKVAEGKAVAIVYDEDLTVSFVYFYESPVAITGVDTVEELAEALADAEEDEIIVLAADVELEEAWTPVGTEQAPFSGTFDGNGNTIYGLEIDGEEGAFFGYVADGAIIENVTFEDVDVNGTYVAAVAYYAGAATIENVQVSGSISAENYAAGIVFEADGTTIQNCDNEAEITSDFSASGIGAWVMNATVDGCNNYGDVTGGNRAGGICGNFSGTMTNCVNDGDVTCTGGMPAGGIIGVLSGATTIENCTNNGDVTNSGTNQYNSSAAGILAQTPSAKVTIKSCVNNGDITAEKSWAAGIGVSLYGGITAEGCSNTGAIQGTKTADTVNAKGMFGGANTVTD